MLQIRGSAEAISVRTSGRSDTGIRFFFLSFFEYLCKTLNGAVIYMQRNDAAEVHLNVLTHHPICRGLKLGLAQGASDEEEEAKGNREKASIGICIVTVR